MQFPIPANQHLGTVLPSGSWIPFSGCACARGGCSPLISCPEGAWRLCCDSKHLQTSAHRVQDKGQNRKVFKGKNPAKRLSSPVPKEAPGVSCSSLVPSQPCRAHRGPWDPPQAGAAHTGGRSKKHRHPSPCCPSPPLPADGWFLELPLPVLDGQSFVP